MKARKPKTAPDDMREEYDFSKGVRGKYVKRFAKGYNVVILESDIAEGFKTSKAVNTVPRKLMRRAGHPRP